LALTAAVVYADSFRLPDDQVSARAYIALVHSYQRMIRPELAGLVQCRFSPTCSHYSTEAVRRYGLRRGLALTAARLWRCRRSVPLGSRDPVP
ncbi:MAG: membrane protein insertion efficiency factor YidD, partial [Terriglobales bacterium]